MNRHRDNLTYGQPIAILVISPKDCITYTYFQSPKNRVEGE